MSKTTVRVGLLALVVTSFMSACSSGDKEYLLPDVEAPDATLPDVSDLDVEAVDIQVGLDVGDVRDEDSTPLEGEFGSPCEENNNCLSGWCVTSNVGPLCTRTCLEDCPSGWSCVGITGETDVVFLCIPKGDRLCKPCALDTQCGSGYCLTFDEGQRCTASCDEVTDCPTGYLCEEVQSEAIGDKKSFQCVPEHDSCECLPGSEGLERPCNEQNDNGLCWGVETCQGTDGWSACDAPVPAVETCDGVDNNCNRFTDESLPTESCEVTNEFGSCPGLTICEGETGFRCAAKAAAPDTCNYLDDNCDGFTDDAFVDAATGLYLGDENCGVCGNSCVGFYPNAVSGCAADGAIARCVVTTCAEGFYKAGPTTCLPVVPAGCLPCTADANCVVPGNACTAMDGGSFCTEDCGPNNLNGRAPGTCAAGYECTTQGARSVCLPLTRSCSCLDSTDNGQTRPCTQANASGTCAGTQTCAPSSGGFSACTARVPGQEICNGIDDNCDGRVDEAVVAPTTPCENTNESGTCSGSWLCSGTNGWTCTALTPAAETCNYQDDDCDGLTDEAFRDDNVANYTALEHCGLCGRDCDEVVLFSTSTECRVEDGLSACIALTCDEGFYVPPDTNRVCVPTSGARACSPCADNAQCAELPGGLCSNIDGGRFCTRGCQSGADCDDGYSCDGGRCLPVSRSCTCLAGQGGTLRPCVNQNVAGACTGVQSCSPTTTPGWSTCSAAVPKAELCNGADDNCNGRVDENVTHDPTGCEITNAAGTCVSTYRCDNSNGWQCPVSTPSTEICNYQDDDCNDRIDETFRDASGRYVNDENCGVCGYSCIGSIPNAEARCALSGTTPRCEVAQCLPGFYKVGPLTCLPASDLACMPCFTDANCPTPGDKCLDVDGSRVCGRDCSANNLHGNPTGACDDGYSCTAVGTSMQCVPTSGSCSCLGDNEDDVRACSITTAAGRCTGTELCAPDQGWLGCTASTPANETCNGIDDNCNGQTDENAPRPTAACEVANNFGTCGGTWTCGGTNSWNCNAKTPAAETCNGLDDDCDGAVDEDMKVNGVYATDAHCGACGLSCAGALPNASETCRVTNGNARCEVATCDPGYYQASALTCLRATDSTCLACTTDANCPTPGDKCLALDGGGFCGRDCGADNRHGLPAGQCDPGFECIAVGASQQCVPTSRSCSCLTDDDGDSRSCRKAGAAGTCFGEEYCDVTSGWAGCTAREPGAELCDGIDNDCDGFVDEALAHSPATCESTVAGVGTCSGNWVCRGEGGWDCPVQTPEVEACDFIDNNCGGGIDESFRDSQGRYVDDENCGSCGVTCEGAIPNADAACAIGPRGSARCEVGACEPGFWKSGPLSCTAVTDLTCQSCTTDANCRTPGDRCVTLGGGEKVCGRDCSDTNLHGAAAGECDTGFACSAFLGGPNQCVPSSGTCGCLAANDGTSRACVVTNPAGTCFGSEMCDSSAGWVDCSAKIPAAEACDGLDNDCDTFIDEGVTHQPATCENTVVGVGTCTATYTCGGTNGWQCNPRTPEAEVCDFIDNNCDGSVDETFKNAGGLYTAVDNCGSCGVTCVGAIPNATEACNVVGGNPRCEVATCDAGYYRAGPTTCLPASDNTCAPCSTDANCQTPGDRCLTLDNGQFCGRNCSADNNHGNPAGECDAGFACVAVAGGADQCQPTSRSCSCLADDDGDSRSCQTTNASGTCFGAQLCAEATGWSVCSAKTPGAEMCNGADDDCDGSVDEALVHSPTTCNSTVAGIGTCTGTWSCNGLNGWQCPVQTPSAEVCDFLDNNCQGGVDESFRDTEGRYVNNQHCGSCGVTCANAIPNATAKCAIGPSGAPRCEVDTCDTNYWKSGPLSCTPVSENTCESCNVDGDCGTPGDRCVTLSGGEKVCGRDCSDGNSHNLPAGQCDAGFGCAAIAGGPDQCVPDSGTCTCLPSNSGATRTCAKNNANGTCFGSETCNPSSGWVGCSAKTPAAEICDGADNDCDSFIDENVSHTPSSCSNVVAGVGTCSANYFCGGTSGWQCNAAAPAVETCDFADNNCNGSVDESFRDAQGRYVAVDNCGSCGVSCVGAIPNATETCAIANGNPRCEVQACDVGYYKAGPTTCLPASDNTCSPCSTDANCATPGDRCLTLDGAKFCGRDCSAGNNHGLPAGQCGAGFECAAIAGGADQCRPLSGSCSCLDDDDGDSRSCQTTNGSGTCFGAQICDADTGWTVCSAKTPGAEMCNGADDDCDGFVDETLTHSPANCSSTVAGVGTCTGTWSCNGASGWLCPVQTPTAEVCDFLDNNCQNGVDETFRDAQGRYVNDQHCGSCGVTCENAIANAVTTCAIGPAGTPRCEVAACEAGYWKSGPLSCSLLTESTCQRCNVDGDCGIPGNRCVDLGDGEKVCGRDCSATNLYGQAAGACNAGFTCQTFTGGPNQCVPTSGTCTCLPGNNGATRTCANNNAEGTCFGSETCNATSGWVGCSARIPAAELCDGIDNNCNSFIDESLSHSPATCSTTVAGIGTCSATYTCGATNGWQCAPANPVAEVCDFLDNNCDGSVDESFKNAGGLYVSVANCGSCGVSCVGAIPNATTTCAVSNGSPRCEVATCNAGYYKVGPTTCLPAVDNTCAPCQTDANCQTPGDRCLTLDGQKVCGRNCSASNSYGTAAGFCPSGSTCQAFTGGANQCVPSSGSCTCRTGNSGDSRNCVSSNGVGTCFGTQTCAPTGGGWSVCTASTPVPETCNAIDDDCNGQLDDVAGRGQSCQITNGFGICAGVRSCVGGSSALVCSGQTPAAETCNYADDDCDSTVDEGFPRLNAICPAGTGACRRVGFEVCNASGSDTVCNVSAGAPATEICDGIDNDCDELVDEEAAWNNKGLPCTDGKGVCRVTGVYQCTGDGAGLACSVTPPAPLVTNEVGLCNQLDDDCDGSIDEDFDNKGNVCSVGNGTCRTFGNFICSQNGASTVCDGVAGQPGVESCDLLDNNCDGQTDEPFKNASGKYATNTTCGNCFTDCTQIYNRPNGFGTCNAVPASPTCRLDCNSGYFDLNTVPGDGCEFFLDPTAIYVGRDAPGAAGGACGLGPVGTGVGNFPCATIAQGFARATATGRSKLIVADGLYAEQVTIINGVSLLGGYRSDTWERHLSSTATIIRGPGGTGDRKAIIATGITQTTRVEGFVVNAANATSQGANSYGIYIQNSSNALTVSSNLIFAGLGGLGSSGPAGTSGQNGLAGANGASTKHLSACTTTPSNAGGTGGSKTCANPSGSGSTTVGGGKGGDSVCPARSVQEGGGVVGQNTGGTGGAGGWGHNSSSSGCSPSSGVPEVGEPGSDAVVGATQDGVRGDGCSVSIGDIVSGEWRGTAGAFAAHGAHGAGGGGGGAGSGGRISSSSYDISGSGGGGGSGGCAGARGAGGSPGGASIGIFVYWPTGSRPTTAAGVPVIISNTVVRNQGGPGGGGGNGGSGGDPGAGGNGGALVTTGLVSPVFCVFGGAKGGFGSRGGHGGGGGGGCGGVSFDILAWGMNSQTHRFFENSFPNDGLDTGGDGGTGGNSSNTLRGGTSGTAGTSANVRTVN